MTRGYAYKVLGTDREACHGGHGRWAQRKRWMPRIEHVEPCVSGYHLCRDEKQLLQWIGPAIWVAEYEGDVVDGGNKIVVSRARLIDRVDAWNEHSARLFACDCAERVVHLHFDPRMQAAIKAARLYANGQIGRDELNAAWNAAGAAARTAAGAAARTAARAAEREWQATRLREITGGLPA